MIYLKNLTLICVTALLFIIQSCDLEGTCESQLEVPVIRFEMPDSVHIDSTAQFNIVYVTYSNCSKLNSVQSATEGDTISVHIVADYIGCSCPDELPDSVAIVKYKPAALRNYIFRAIKYDNTILQDTLKVFDTER